MANRKIDAPVELLLEMREKREMSNQEIADELGISLKTVLRRIGKQPGQLTKKKKEEGVAKARADKLERATRIAKRVMLAPVEEEPTQPVVEPPRQPITIMPPKLITPIKSRITLKADLFEHAYIGDWESTLRTLAQMAQPEPWGFKTALPAVKLPDLCILNMYIRHAFRRSAIMYNSAKDDAERDSFFHVRNNLCCFNTGLQTPFFKDIYMIFVRNPRKDNLLSWKFLKFDTEKANELKFVTTLPSLTALQLLPESRFDLRREIRANVEHILSDPANYERLPESIRDAWNLPLAFETAVAIARRKATTMPSLVVEGLYGVNVQYLLPLYMTNDRAPDLILTLEEKDNFYTGHTCLTPAMAYSVARSIGQPTVRWLTELVE